MDARLTADAVASMFPMMTGDDYEALKNDIREHGVRQPIILHEGRILDGRNRYHICRELKVPCPSKNWDGKGSKVSFVVSENLHRRHLNPGQKAAIASEVEPMLAAEAKQRQKLSKGRGKKGVEKIPHLNSDDGRARKQASKLFGVNPHYVTDAKKIKNESPDLFEDVKSGKTTIQQAKQEIRRKETTAKLEDVSAKQAKAAEGVYDVLVIDPPWPMEKIERDCRPNQVKFDYPTMTETELAAMKIPAAKDCHAWIWTTHKFLPMALRLLDSWRLKYVCTFVWHKPGGFQVVGLPQFNCEFALYARRGSPEFVSTKAFKTCFEAARGKHSEKPDEFYEMISRATAGRRLDMFSRRSIDGFDAWGKEAERVAG